MPSVNEPVLHVSLCTSKEWREQPSRYRLVGSRCMKCGETYFPKRWACPKCHSNQLEEYKLKPVGQVVESSIGYGLTLGHEEMCPMQGAVIKIEDGPLIATEIVSSEFELKPGTRVEMVIRKVGRDSLGSYVYGYKFAPSSQTTG